MCCLVFTSLHLIILFKLLRSQVTMISLCVCMFDYVGIVCVHHDIIYIFSLCVSCMFQKHIQKSKTNVQSVVTIHTIILWQQDLFAIQDLFPVESLWIVWKCLEHIVQRVSDPVWLWYEVSWPKTRVFSDLVDTCWVHNTHTHTRHIPLVTCTWIIQNQNNLTHLWVTHTFILWPGRISKSK